MSDRFYTRAPLARGEFVLDGAEAHHLATVRRFVAGDRVVLFNGDGRDYPAEIVSIGKRSAVLNILDAVDANRESAVPLIVAAALPKGDRADFLIEKLTELGVTRFVPLITARSVVQPKDAKIEKFERAVIEASKQCGRNVLMAVSSPTKWSEFVRATELLPVKLLLHTEGGEPFSALWRAGGVSPLILSNGVVVAIGPEGGFTSDEVVEAIAVGWRLISLGPRTLRIETAAMAIAACLGQR